MALNFTRTSSMYLSNAAAVLTAAPLTMACWFRSTELTNIKTLMGLSDTAGIQNHWLLRLQTTEAVNALCTAAGSGNAANSTASFSSGVWAHAAGVWTATSRRALLNGANAGAGNATSLVPASIDTTAIGATVFNTNSNFMDGDVAEAAIWNAALTDAEVAVLATGLSPLNVRPGNLVAYWPLIGNLSPEIDLVGGFNMTLNAAPTKSDHTRVLYYTPPPFMIKAAAAAANTLFAQSVM